MSSRRKHVKQMSKAEREFLSDTRDRLKDQLRIRHHCNDRKDLKVMTAEEIITAAKYGRIIECHNDVGNDIRILVRHDTKDPISICAVISLKDGSIVTAYPNAREDKHYTLDWSLYRWKVDLVSEVKRFLQRQSGGAKNSRNLQQRWR